MYLTYYKLNKKPFQISTDPKFLWLGKKHQEALSILKYGIEDDKGFLVLTGDVGTGKTTLLNAFVNSLGDDVIVARVSDPGLTKLDFIKYIATKFRMDTDFETKSDFLILFTSFLENANQAGKKVLLIIDEAQHLTDEILEEIRLLSNIESQDKKLLNIFLVGQNEFNPTLEKYKNRALRQRITINYTLYPLEPEETKTYIEYRLGIAGVQKQLFTPAAIDAIHTLSEGFPRVINIICDNALFQGCQEEQSEIADEMIWKISKNLRFAQVPQGLGESDLSDSSDDHWLEEVSELPPLTLEEIQKASQPLPDIIEDTAQEQISRSYKYVVAVPIFIITFLLSGYFVIEDSKIEVIKQYLINKYNETIGTPIHSEKKEEDSQKNSIEINTLVTDSSEITDVVRSTETIIADQDALTPEKKTPSQQPEKSVDDAASKPLLDKEAKPTDNTTPPETIPTSAQKDPGAVIDWLLNSNGQE